jgi:hypothetical protein
MSATILGRLTVERARVNLRIHRIADRCAKRSDQLWERTFQAYILTERIEVLND